MKGRVVDLGCGSKPFKQYLDGEYIGVDNANGTPDIVASVTKVPLEDECADSVICSEVLEHLPQPDLCLKEIVRLLRKDGYVYITVPMYWYLHYMPNDYWRFTNIALISMLTKNGLRIKYLNRYGGLNYFIAARISESIYDQLKKIVNKTIALKLLMPLQILLYWYSLLDKFNKRDTAGWVILAQK